MTTPGELRWRVPLSDIRVDDELAEAVHETVRLALHFSEGNRVSSHLLAVVVY